MGVGITDEERDRRCWRKKEPPNEAHMHIYNAPMLPLVSLPVHMKCDPMMVHISSSLTVEFDQY